MAVIDYMDPALAPGERAKLLLPKLTMGEKVGQLNQRLYGFHSYMRTGDALLPSPDFVEEVKRCGGLGVLYGLFRADPWSQRDFTNGLVGTLARQAYNMLQGIVLDHSRFGIPMLLSSECPHGHLALGGYLLPVNLAVGATFHPKLLGKAAAICGLQLREAGVNLALVSMLDILRDPRWGRSEECFGEDPYHASAFAKELVMAIQSQGVGVVAKHFCAQGETTGGLNASAARIGERELREIHLPVVEACCQVGVTGVMAAYNEVDGIFCHANRALLTDLLRGEYGFRGVVMADGCAIDELMVMTGDLEQAAAVALHAGLDISLWDEAFSRLEHAVERGLVREEAIDQAVLRVLTLKFAQGLFERPFLPEDRAQSDYSYTRFPQSLQLARESAVLLKNEKRILPLAPRKGDPIHIAVIGPAADDLYRQLGDYTPPLAPNEGVTIWKSMQRLAPPWVEVEYAQGCAQGQEDANELLEAAVGLAQQSDVVVLVLGGSSSRFEEGARFAANGAAAIETGGSVLMDCGEGVDLAGLTLPNGQTAVFEAVLRTGKPLTTVVIAGRPYAIPRIAEQSDGLLYCFYPGPMGGQAVAEILYGIVSPSGRLPVSLPRSPAQLPVYYNTKNSYRSRHYSDLPDSPLFCFGAGFGYGELHYQDFVLSARTISLEDLAHTPLTIRFRVHNVGARDDIAVPQLYVRLLRGSTVRRTRELKAFVRLLVPSGECVNGQLSLGVESFGGWNPRMEFVAEPGEAMLYLMDSDRLLWSGALVLTGREMPLRLEKP